MTRAHWVRIGAIAVLGVAIGWAYVHRSALDVGTLERAVHSAGPWAPAAFMAIYALATVLFVPGSVLTLAGGALFGPVAGTFYNLTGATLGATAAFFIARHLASDWVRARTGGRARQMVEGVEREDWRFIAFVRLVPLFPFNLLNYALGLTHIRISRFVLVSYLTMLPGALAYTYLGYAGREAAAGGAGLIQKGLIALALLAAVALLPRLVRRIRSAPSGTALSAADLRQRLDERKDVLVLDVRAPADYSGLAGHIPGARNIPLGELPGRMVELESYRERPLAVVCRTNRMSTQAATLLRDAGFRQVLLVHDGMVGWERGGFATEK
ncbi:MAG: VTT domain-containing protein [Gammaproteobacteria bacterium]|nr:VTT domain-containing protein [Gammaproteobacteria bacterium]